MFKRLISLITITIILAVGMVNIYAAEKPVEIKVSVNNTEINTPSGASFIQGYNIFFVPFRDIAEVLNYSVSYDSKQNAAVAMKEGIKVVYPIGEKYYLINDKRINLPYQTLTKDGRTYVELRSIVSSLGEVVALLENRDGSVKYIDIFSHNNGFNAKFTKVENINYTTQNDTDSYNTSLEPLFKVTGNKIFITNLDETTIPALENIITGITQLDDVGQALARDFLGVWNHRSEIKNQFEEITEKDGVTTYNLKNSATKYMGNVTYDGYSGWQYEYQKTKLGVLFTITKK